jgi:hypothetical protein
MAPVTGLRLWPELFLFFSTEDKSPANGKQWNEVSLDCGKTLYLCKKCKECIAF